MTTEARFEKTGLAAQTIDEEAQLVTFRLEVCK